MLNDGRRRGSTCKASFACACPSDMVTLAAQRSEESLLFLYQKRTCTARALNTIQTCLKSLSGAWAPLRSQPPPRCCSSNSIGENATMQQSQHTARTLTTSELARRSATKTPLVSPHRQETSTEFSLACSTRKDVQDLLPPAVEDSAQSLSTAVLLRAVSSSVSDSLPPISLGAPC